MSIDVSYEKFNMKRLELISKIIIHVEWKKKRGWKALIRYQQDRDKNFKLEDEFVFQTRETNAKGFISIFFFVFSLGN